MSWINFHGLDRKDLKLGYKSDTDLFLPKIIEIMCLINTLRVETSMFMLRWEILLLDFFAVGDCGTGLFCCGRFYCWTFLLWEILMLDFLASGQMNRQAQKAAISIPRIELWGFFSIMACFQFGNDAAMVSR